MVWLASVRKWCCQRLISLLLKQPFLLLNQFDSIPEVLSSEQNICDPPKVQSSQLFQKNPETQGLISGSKLRASEGRNPPAIAALP